MIHSPQCDVADVRGDRSSGTGCSASAACSVFPGLFQGSRVFAQLHPRYRDGAEPADHPLLRRPGPFPRPALESPSSRSCNRLKIKRGDFVGSVSLLSLPCRRSHSINESHGVASTGMTTVFCRTRKGLRPRGRWLRLHERAVNVTQRDGIRIRASYALPLTGDID